MMVSTINEWLNIQYLSHTSISNNCFKSGVNNVNIKHVIKRTQEMPSIIEMTLTFFKKEEKGHTQSYPPSV